MVLVTQQSNTAVIKINIILICDTSSSLPMATISVVFIGMTVVITTASISFVSSSVFIIWSSPSLTDFAVCGVRNIIGDLYLGVFLLADQRYLEGFNGGFSGFDFKEFHRIFPNAGKCEMLPSIVFTKLSSNKFDETLDSIDMKWVKESEGIIELVFMLIVEEFCR